VKTGKILSLILVIILAFSFAGCKKNDAKDAADKNIQDIKAPGKVTGLKSKVSYIIGHDIGGKLKKGLIDVDFGAFNEGLKAGLKGSKSKYSPEEQQAVWNEMQVETMKKSKIEGEKNKKAGLDYLEKNKANKDVVALASGLQYKIIKDGTGAMPKETDTVKVNYVGKLIDGTEFDSSIKNGQPAVFPLNGVIQGWQEALKLMKTGSKWEVYIPSDLAYGDQGMQGAIPPGSTLIFEVEFLEIVKVK